MLMNAIEQNQFTILSPNQIPKIAEFKAIWECDAMSRVRDHFDE